MSPLEYLQFPIGRFNAPEFISEDLIKKCIATIDAFPTRIQSALEKRSDEQLDTVYRPGGWTIRQVVHHCSDSHMHSLLRFKWALTEKSTTIKPYEEALWAELADSKSMPIEPALSILKGVHARWVVLLKSMTEEQFQRVYIHPEYQTRYTLAEATALYAWHCEHHLAHIVNLLKEKGW
jgi:hypothetical protein